MPSDSTTEIPTYADHDEFLRFVRIRQAADKAMRSGWKIPRDVEAAEPIMPTGPRMYKNSWKMPGGGLCSHPHSNMTRSAQEGLERFEASERDLAIGRELERRGL